MRRRRRCQGGRIPCRAGSSIVIGRSPSSIRKAWEGRAMSLGFLNHMKTVPDHRIPGMVTYPTPSRVGGSALRRGRRRPADRQQDRPRKPRNPLRHHVPRTRSQGHSRRDTRALGGRKRSLDAGRDLRRRPLQDQKRRFGAEFRRHHSAHRLQPPQSRQHTRLVAPQTRPGLHRPGLFRRATDPAAGGRRFRVASAMPTREDPRLRRLGRNSCSTGPPSPPTPTTRRSGAR